MLLRNVVTNINPTLYSVKSVNTYLDKYFPEKIRGRYFVKLNDGNYYLKLGIKDDNGNPITDIYSLVEAYKKKRLKKWDAAHQS